MKLVSERSNYRVEVFLLGYMVRNSTHEEIVRDLRRISTAILSRVDDVAAADVVWDTTLRCPYCNIHWELDANGFPTCCENAVDEWTGKET